MMDVKNSPAVPGLTFRHFQGESDYSSITRVLIGSEAADQTERKVSADDIANAYQHLSNCDPYRDMIIAEIDGEMIGYSRGWWRDESLTGHLYEHNGFLLPRWRRKGIGHAMLVWMEDRLRDLAATHPPEIAKSFEVNVSQFQKGTVVMLERSSYRAMRYFFDMVRPTLDDIPEMPLPEGLDVRPALPDHYRAIWQSVDETSQDEWGYEKATDEDYQEWLTNAHFQPHLWQVAWDTASNQVVGHVLTFIDHDENEQFNRKRGYTEGIGVDRSWRRRGLARALISLSLRAQKAAGMTESALAADGDSANSVTRLYESCGFQVVRWNATYRKAM